MATASGRADTTVCSAEVCLHRRAPRSPGALRGRGRQPGRHRRAGHRSRGGRRQPIAEAQRFTLADGAVVIAAITSCTNTSNPAVMVGAGSAGPQRRGARTAGGALGEDQPGSRFAGGHRLPASAPGCCPIWRRWASTSWATAAPPASATAGPLPVPIAEGIIAGAAGDGRGPQRQPQLRGAHPPAGAGQLPGVAHAGGRVRAGRDASTSISPPSRWAHDASGQPVYLRDLWPSPEEVAALVGGRGTRAVPGRVRARGRRRRDLAESPGAGRATCIAGTRLPPTCRSRRILSGCRRSPRRRGTSSGARVLGIFGDSVTTDHISPAGSIAADAPAGLYLVRSWLSRRATSTPTARGGATTR